MPHRRSLATSNLAAYLDLVDAGLSLTPRDIRRVYISWFTCTYRHPSCVLSSDPSGNCEKLLEGTPNGTYLKTPFNPLKGLLSHKPTSQRPEAVPYNHELQSVTLLGSPSLAEWKGIPILMKPTSLPRRQGKSELRPQSARFCLENSEPYKLWNALAGTVHNNALKSKEGVAGQGTTGIKRNFVVLPVLLIVTRVGAGIIHQHVLPAVLSRTQKHASCRVQRYKSKSCNASSLQTKPTTQLGMIGGSNLHCRPSLSRPFFRRNRSWCVICE